ncbi:MaoC family dehydratase [Colwellia demingiae]|uniref:MaoC family dehydratase n=1 Tax=Colwellia demingiae TaxID=89401 RepID=A0A5C6QGR9_9GAMM|nr:MaoC family dehydratase [Colwellia demingiae]TWX67910.1 MaoC family dehydratase [Colwellia demingiae]
MSFTIEQLHLGQKDHFEKTFSNSDVMLFAEISGDRNPVHINDIAAKNSVFGQRVVHGAFVLSTVSALLGEKLPGEGTIYLGQESKFTAPVFIDDTVIATCEVVEIIKDKNIVKLRCTLVNQAGKVVAEGLATVMPPKKQHL